MVEEDLKDISEKVTKVNNVVIGKVNIFMKPKRSLH